MSEITWAEVREELAGIQRAGAAAIDNAIDCVTFPTEDVRADRIYVDAFASLLFAERHAHRRLEALVERVASAAPPARSLDAVLADIVALGHPDIKIHRRRDGRWECETTNGAREYASMPQLSQAAWAEWKAMVEHGVGAGDTLRASMAARLAQIRELHAAKLAKDGIAADVPPEVIHRAMDDIARAERERDEGASESAEEEGS